MSCRKFPTIPNPVRICQEIYGLYNVNDVRDAIVNSVRRFYGYCDINDLTFDIIQPYMVQILIDAGRNPKAVRLAMPPSIFQLSIFPTRYIDQNFDKEKAYQLALKDCENYPNCNDLRKECFIDYQSV